MKFFVIAAALMFVAPSFGLTLDPGETARIGHTLVTCSMGESQLAPCGVSSKGCLVGQLRVLAGEETLECQTEESAMARIQKLKELGVCL